MHEEELWRIRLESKWFCWKVIQFGCPVLLQAYFPPRWISYFLPTSYMKKNGVLNDQARQELFEEKITLVLYLAGFEWRKDKLLHKIIFYWAALSSISQHIIRYCPSDYQNAKHKEFKNNEFQLKFCFLKLYKKEKVRVLQYIIIRPHVHHELRWR